MGIESEKHLERILKIVSQRGLTQIVQWHKFPGREFMSPGNPIPDQIMGQYCLITWEIASPIMNALPHDVSRVTALHCSDAQIESVRGRYCIKHDVLEVLYSADEEGVKADVFDPYLATAELLAEVIHGGIQYRIEYTGDSISIRHRKENASWNLPQYWRPSGTVFMALIGVCRELQRVKKEAENDSRERNGKAAKIW